MPSLFGANITTSIITNTDAIATNITTNSTTSIIVEIADAMHATLSLFWLDWDPTPLLPYIFLFGFFGIFCAILLGLWEFYCWAQRSIIEEVLSHPREEQYDFMVEVSETRLLSWNAAIRAMDEQYYAEQEASNTLGRPSNTYTTGTEKTSYAGLKSLV